MYNVAIQDVSVSQKTIKGEENIILYKVIAYFETEENTKNDFHKHRVLFSIYQSLDDNTCGIEGHKFISLDNLEKRNPTKFCHVKSVPFNTALQAARDYIQEQFSDKENLVENYRITDLGNELLFELDYTIKDFIAKHPNANPLHINAVINLFTRESSSVADIVRNLSKENKQ